MKRLTAVVLLTLLGTAANAASKPVSKYMRDAGILYLEAVEELTPECGRRASADNDCMSHWESTMEKIEDRVSIQLSDKSRRGSAGDGPYWDLLKNARHAHKFFVIAYPGEQKAWIHADVICQGQAHSIALDGNFDSDGGCGAAIDTATHQ
jgi:hypothetical protein